MAPGSLSGVQLVVRDIHAARTELLARGFDPGEVMVYAADGLRPARAEDTDLNNVGFLFFTDPDDNSWAVQQITDRT